MPTFDADVGGFEVSAQYHRNGKRATLAVAAVLVAVPLVTSAGDTTPLVYPYHPSFPMFGPGKFTNLGDSDSTLALGAAHAGWSLAVPLVGEKIAGRKGLWIAGLSWVSIALIQQSFFHTPPHPEPGYRPGPEFRGDLITKLGPSLIVLGVDLIRHGWSRSRPASEPRRGLYPPFADVPAGSTSLVGALHGECPATPVKLDATAQANAPPAELR